MDTVLEKLQQQLAHYGLDPRDWQLRATSDSVFRILPKNEESNFEMLGHACLDEGDWLDVCLISNGRDQEI